jgi:enolase
MFKVKTLSARWILDSRALPTVQCEIQLVDQNQNIYIGLASVPSGASTGSYEALELRDGGQAFHGKGVSQAVNNIISKILPVIENQEFESAKSLDEAVLKLDQSENKSILGANAILGVSMAAHRAFASAKGKELWQYLRDLYFSSLGSEIKYPRLMCNVINGGVHADSGLAIQEFMIIPNMGDLEMDVKFISEAYHTLKKQLKSDGHSISLGDEGGFAPHISTTSEVLDYIQSSVSNSGYSVNQYHIGLDCAASEFYNAQNQSYIVDGKERNGEEMVDFYSILVEKYNLLSIEDAFAEDDITNWSLFKTNLGNKIYQIGDDLFVTNVKRFQSLGLDMDLGNGVLIKLNQIGSVSETCAMINLAKQSNYITAISHRSGETTDSFISDLSVACNSEFIKLGAPARGERVAKFNRLLNIQNSK